MELNKLKKQIFEEIEKVKNPDELEKFRIKHLGRKSKLTVILRSLKDLSVNQRKKIGKDANELKIELENRIKVKKKELQVTSYKLQADKIDITAPGIQLPQGHLHPITQVL